MNKPAFLTCCELGSQFIRLQVDDEIYEGSYPDRESFIAAVCARPPRWKIYARGTEPNNTSLAVTACPFCASLVPPIRLRPEPPDRLCVVLDDGVSSCATCGGQPWSSDHRWKCCECAPIECLYEIATSIDGNLQRNPGSETRRKSV